MLGNEVAELVNEYQSAGSHRAIFDAMKTGNRLPNRLYYYRNELPRRKQRGINV